MASAELLSHEDNHRAAHLHPKSSSSQCPRAHQHKQQQQQRKQEHQGKQEQCQQLHQCEQQRQPRRQQQHQSQQSKSVHLPYNTNAPASTPPPSPSPSPHHPNNSTSNNVQQASSNRTSPTNNLPMYQSMPGICSCQICKRHAKAKEDLREYWHELRQHVNVEIDDEEEEEEEEEEDEEDEDPDEEDDISDDDFCSDEGSTTSTSASNNQREASRVCDCCYCEVFGHGMPAMAPTSKNYNEMRERLRLRLSKRKAEKCEKMKNGKDGCNNGEASAGKDSHLNASSQSHNNKVTEVEDPRDLDELLKFINGKNTSHNSKDNHKDETQRSRKKDKIKNNNSSSSNNKNNKKAQKNTRDGQIHQPTAKNNNNGGNNQANHNSNHVTPNKQKKKEAKNSTQSNGAHHGSNHSANSNNKSTNNSTRNQHQHQPDNHKNQVRKKNGLNNDDTSSPEVVFMPRNIDLNNGQLDEFERELEEFKRFCFNSVPRDQKEKVRVNIKNLEFLRSFKKASA